MITSMKLKWLGKTARLLFLLATVLAVAYPSLSIGYPQANAAANSIYYTTNDWVIRSADIDGTNSQVVFDGGSNLEDLVQPRDLALDTLHGKIYFVDGNMQNIRRINLDGTGMVENITPIAGDVGSRQGISLDVKNEIIYYTTDGPEYAVKSIKMDGSNGRTLYTVPDGTPYDIAIDLKHGKIYFVDGVNGKIVWMDLDGSNVADLIPGQNNVWDVNGLVLDVQGGKIYFTTWDPMDGVERANLDGSGLEVLYSAAQTYGRPGPITLDVSAGKLYYADLDSQNLERLDATGGDPEDVIATMNVEYLTLDPAVPTVVSLKGFTAQPAQAVDESYLFSGFIFSMVGLMLIKRLTK